MDGYKHYVRPNASGVVTYGFSDVSEQAQTGDICIDTNAPRQFNVPLLDSDGVPLYKGVSGQRVNRTPAEMDVDRLTVLKNKKIADLDAACTAAIEGTFVSSAKGVAHTYGYSDKDQKNFGVASGMYNMDPNMTTVDWTTKDTGRVAHARAEFLQLYKDATVTHLNGKITKFHTEKAKINAFMLLADVQAYDAKAVVW